MFYVDTVKSQIFFSCTCFKKLYLVIEFCEFYIDFLGVFFPVTAPSVAFLPWKITKITHITESNWKPHYITPFLLGSAFEYNFTKAYHYLITRKGAKHWMQSDKTQSN